MELIETAPHEFAAHFLFAEHGLAPFFACDRRIKEGDGSQTSKFEFAGEQWEVMLSYRDSGLAHPGARLPSGTEFQLESMREFDLHVDSADEPVGERTFHAHIAPRWQGMRSENGEEIPVPDDVEEGVNLHVQGSNIEFDQYLLLIQNAMSAVRIQRGYFETLHEFLTVLDAERYVRVHEDASGPVHARDGPIAQLGHLLEHDRVGRRKLVQYDSDERGRQQPGYYHTATLGPRRVTEAFPSHALPKEVKHYYAKEAAAMSTDREIAHPKVGVSYQKSFWDDKLGVSKTDIEQLNEELEDLEREAGHADWEREIAVQLMGRCGLRASEVTYPGDEHLRWSDDGEVWLFEVRGKNTKGGQRKVRDAWMPGAVADDVHKYSRERELDRTESWVQASTPSVRRWVKEASQQLAEQRADERWRDVSSHDLRRSWAAYHLVERQVDIRTMMAVGGWSDYSAVEPYLKEPTENRIGEAMRETD